MWGVLQQGISTLDVDFVAYAGEHFDRLLANAPPPASSVPCARPPATGWTPHRVRLTWTCAPIRDGGRRVELPLWLPGCGVRARTPSGDRRAHSLLGSAGRNARQRRRPGQSTTNSRMPRSRSSLRRDPRGEPLVVVVVAVDDHVDTGRVERPPERVHVPVVAVLVTGAEAWRWNSTSVQVAWCVANSVGQPATLDGVRVAAADLRAVESSTMTRQVPRSLAYHEVPSAPAAAPKYLR